MNHDIQQGQWRQMRGEVRAQFGRLTDDDLEVVAGNSESMLGKLQERYGYTREEATDAWDKFLYSVRDRFGDAKEGVQDAWQDTKRNVGNAIDNAGDAVKDAARDVDRRY